MTDGQDLPQALLASRGRYVGVLNILRFNWPFFVVALVGITMLLLWALTRAWSIASLVAIGLALLAGTGIVVSLVVSHLIYDRSALYLLTWVDRALQGLELRSAVFSQTGFDESSALFRHRLPHVAWQVLDHYDAMRMSEASIRRARALCPPPVGTIAAPYDAWPTPTQSHSAVFGILAVHELRTVRERGQWFAEARRVLVPGGRIVVVEHVRDLANFVVFGPGALHFHSMKRWRQSWEPAALRLRETFRITPWVRVFVLEAA